jgi:hypothetical protein
MRRREESRACAGITGLLLAVAAVTVAVCVIPVGHHVPHPLTIGYAAGAAVSVIAGPLLMRYLRRLMLTKARQQMPDAGPIPRCAGRPGRGTA